MTLTPKDIQEQYLNGMEKTHGPLVEYVKRIERQNAEMWEWIKSNCTEARCWKDRDPDCLSCRACDFLDSLHS